MHCIRTAATRDVLTTANESTTDAVTRDVVEATAVTPEVVATAATTDVATVVATAATTKTTDVIKIVVCFIKYNLRSLGCSSITPIYVSTLYVLSDLPHHIEPPLQSFTHNDTQRHNNPAQDVMYQTGRRHVILVFRQIQYANHLITRITDAGPT